MSIQYLVTLAYNQVQAENADIKNPLYQVWRWPEVEPERTVNAFHSWRTTLPNVSESAVASGD